MSKVKMASNNPYFVDIHWDHEDEVYIARVPELVGVVTHGYTMAEAAMNAEEAINLHLKSLEKHGEKAPEPASKKDFNGSFSLRMGEERHRAAFIRQQEIGAKSLNEYICDLLDRDYQGRVLVENNKSEDNKSGKNKIRFMKDTTIGTIRPSKAQIKSLSSKIMKKLLAKPERVTSLVKTENGDWVVKLEDEKKDLGIGMTPADEFARKTVKQTLAKTTKKSTMKRAK
jgi:predicted RNase H-like HicB family nuclease